jgi:preprotein translocase subunit SecG
MGFLIGLLTLVMVLDCVVMIFLVLIQLPKKEAGGVGLAFGASATDALFGAGSGNVLTKITKYAATMFFVMAILLSILYNVNNNRNASAFQKSLGTTMQTPGPGPGLPPALPPGSLSTSAPPASATNRIVLPPAESTNAPAAPK